MLKAWIIEYITVFIDVYINPWLISAEVKLPLSFNMGEYL